MSVRYRILDFLGYPGYRVGTDGSVWSRLLRTAVRGPGRRGSVSGLSVEWKKLQPVVDKGTGYTVVSLCNSGKTKTFLVHQLVLLAFEGPRPEGMVCRHLDGNPVNNNRGNLCWGTHRENMQDMVRHGRSARGNRNGARLHPERMPRGYRHGSRTHPECCHRGEQASWSKLSGFAVRFCRLASRRNGGCWSDAGLGRLFEVTGSAIRKVILRKTWAQTS